MGISSLQAGLLVASCAGIAITGIISAWNMYPDLNCLPFSHRSRRRRGQTEEIALEAEHRLSATSVDGEMEEYVELYIPPNRNPLYIGLDIINRMLLATALPMCAANQDEISDMEQGHASRLTTRLSRLTSITPGQLSEFFSANQAAVLSQFAADSDNPSLITAVSRIQRDSLSLSLIFQEIARKESANYIRDGQCIVITREGLATGIEHAQRRQHEVFTIGDGEDDGDETEAVMPVSQTNFGTGKGMAQLYIQPNVTGQ